MLGEERRQYILNIVNKTGGIKAAEAAESLNLSEITIRRDLDRLAKNGLLKRTHGGAISNFPAAGKINFDPQGEIYIKEKKKIALAASALIEEDDVILIEAGTTGYHIALDISGKKNLTVITNSCDIAAMLGTTSPQYKITLSGGMLNAGSRSLTGPVADSTFRSTFADKAFIDISGIDIYKGITSEDPIEAQTKKFIIGSARQVIAVCDSSRIGHVLMNLVAPVKVINTFITDSEADSEFTEKLKEMEIELILA